MSSGYGSNKGTSNILKTLIGKRKTMLPKTVGFSRGGRLFEPQLSSLPISASDLIETPIPAHSKGCHLVFFF